MQRVSSQAHRCVFQFAFLALGILAAIRPAAAGTLVYTLTGYLQANSGGMQFSTSFTWTINGDASRINTLMPGVLGTPAVSSAITFPGIGTLPLANVVIELNTNSGQITFGNPFSGGITFSNPALKQYGLATPLALLTGTDTLVAGTLTGTDGTIVNLTGAANTNNGPGPTFQAALPGPIISSVTNAASYILPGLPNAAIAQGAIFVLFGSGLGPQNISFASVPFQATNVSGASVVVTVNGTTVNAPMYYASDGQAAALLPSNTPTGSGTITATYNGVAGQPAPITVVANNLGIFTIGSNGQGPAIVTYADYSLVSDTKAANCGGPNTTCGAANPGDTLILWATGLGPVNGNDASGAGLGQNMPNIPLTVWLGGVQAPVVYQGRSGCCVGEDQIVFTVPSNAPTGCAVPLAIQINSEISNYTAMPVAAGSRSCTPSDPALSQVNIEQDVTAGPLNYGTITLSRDSNAPNPGFTDDAKIQLIKVLTYGAGSQPFFASYLDLPPLGSCTVYNLLSPSSKPPIATFAALDAGANFTIMGPSGSQSVPVSGTFSTAVLSASGAYLAPGAYTVSGTGGADIGDFTAMATIPAAPMLNTPALGTRSAGTTVTWSGGQPNAVVEIQLIAPTDNTNTNGATARCYVPSSAGMLTIPPYVTLALPATNFGTFQFQQQTLGAFTANGLSIGEIQTNNAATSVPFVSQ